MNARRAARAAEKLARRCYPILSGQERNVQGAALVDLVAHHLAGHVVVGDEQATALFREMMLEAFIRAVRGIMPIIDKEDIQPELKRRMQ